ncbi:hypothetical protein WMF04_19045 [Sorangium sp. So ce260]|uniref:hypothetical protein n=1 Tax=Sorangium sp. So ce260 TaxID=3133291 RepID=UPI003F5FDBCA
MTPPAAPELPLEVVPVEAELPPSPAGSLPEPDPQLAAMSSPMKVAELTEIVRVRVFIFGSEG